MGRDIGKNIDRGLIRVRGRLQDKRTLFFTLFFFFFLFSPAASAGYLLNKVKIYLSQTNMIDTLKLTNPDSKPVDIQTQILSWTQQNGNDVYQPTADIIVSPPIMRIAPSKTQLLRVGWRTPTALSTEKAYRIFLQEITPNTPLSQTGVRVKLRMGIPIFILPATPIYKIDWRVQGLSGKSLKVLANNIGNAHVQIIGAKLTTPDGKTTMGEYNSSIYLLPGQNTVLSFTMTNVGTKTLLLKAQTDNATMQSNITLP